jgi:hypothetical protein
MKRRIPPERLACFDAVAEASRRQRVLVACCSRTVRRQYLRALERRGANLNNVYFLSLNPGEIVEDGL